VIFFSSCNKNAEQKDIFSTKPISLQEFTLPDGADESVSAEQGGKGYTGDGWITNENYLPQGSEKSFKGGRLSFSIDYFPVTFAPVGKDANTIINSVLRNLLYESLLKKDIFTDEFIPSLASHWQISSDSVTFRFRIDPYSRWANGSRITADDVLKTYDLYTDSDFLDPYQSQLWKSYDRPVKESMYIFSVRSHKKDWRQFNYFAENFFILPGEIIKKTDGKSFAELFQFNPIAGSGPYVILPQDIQKGISFTIRRRSDYWAEKKKFALGLNNFDEINAYFIQDANLAFEKFKKGELDIYSVKSAQQFNEGFNFDKVSTNQIVRQKIYTQKYPGFQGICFNTRRGIFKDKNLRKAMAYLFDKNKFIEKIFYGEYVPEFSRFPGTQFENKSNPRIGFNPDSAAILLKQSGYKVSTGDKIIEFELCYLPGFQKILEIYQGTLSEYGIKVHLKQVDAAYLSKILNDKNFDAVAVSFALPYIPAPEISFLSDYANAEGGQNWEGIRNSAMDSLCKLFPIEFNKSLQVEIMKKIDSIATSNFGIIPMWYLPYERVAYQNKFGYPEYCLPRYGNFYDILQYWFYDIEKVREYVKGKDIKSVPSEIDFWNSKK
jgi:microcin C transport system substrate-binding protein